MNAFAERLIFFMICIQMGTNIINSTEIIPGMTLTSGQVNNAFTGGFGNTPALNWFAESANRTNTGLIYGQNCVDNISSGTTDAWVIVANLWNLIANVAIVLINLLLVLVSLFLLVLGLLLGAVFGGILFWPAIFTVIDPVSGALWGSLFGGLQTIIIIYALGTEALEIAGSKGKSLATGGAAGQ